MAPRKKREEEREYKPSKKKTKTRELVAKTLVDPQMRRVTRSMARQMQPPQNRAGNLLEQVGNPSLSFPSSSPVHVPALVPVPNIAVTCPAQAAVGYSRPPQETTPPPPSLAKDNTTPSNDPGQETITLPPPNLPQKPVTGLPPRPDARPRRAVRYRDGDIIGYKSAKIDECNVGFKLLQRMGWKEGQGIGVAGGRAVPITAVIKNTRLGLGAKARGHCQPIIISMFDKFCTSHLNTRAVNI